MVELLQNYLEYILIPIVAAIVGWGTNWIAIQMTFYPIEPIGRPPYLGWVGIIPSKAEKMGRIATRSVLNKLGTLREVFTAMQPEKIAEHVIHTMEGQVEPYIDSVMHEDEPVVWEVTPEPVKSLIYRMVRLKMPETIHRITQDVQDHIEDMIDLEWTVVERLKGDKTLTNRIFLEVGAREFSFIINSGFYFGFVLGVIQAVMWYYVQVQFGTFDPQTGEQIGVVAPWLLPMFGAVVGYATNMLALRIVFSPVEPIRIGPWEVQGLFLKRQAEVADVWTSIVTKEILSVRNIVDSMLNGPKAARTQAVIRHHVRRTTDEVLGPTRFLAQGAMGVRDYAHLKDSTADAAIRLSLAALDDPVFNAERGAVVKGLMVERMKALSSVEFQMLLRPAFQEDEAKLIILGGVLGALAGLLQILSLY